MSLEILSQLLTTQAAIGNALTVPQQIFVSANYKKFAEYLNSDAGRAAVRTFVDDWQHAIEPPQPKAIEETAIAETSEKLKSFKPLPINYKVKL